ncbi:MAG: trehalose-phosphatase [Deltaproteobacteria bacterium]
MSREKRSSSHLFNHWTEVRRRVRRARHIALMLDFDGTLAPICRHPRQVRLSSITRAALRRLARIPRVRIAIISGRRRPDVCRHVAVRGISYLGLHGWERGQNSRATTSLHRFIQRLRREVESTLRGMTGVWIEDKYAGFTVHCRLSPPGVAKRAHAALKQVLASHLSRVRILDGKKVWEVLPREVKGKGEAVRAVLKEFGPALPVYAGDDFGDEAAFAALPRGITVRVGPPRRTHARYQLRDPEEMREFLERLEGEVS